MADKRISNVLAGMAGATAAVGAWLLWRLFDEDRPPVVVTSGSINIEIHDRETPDKENGNSQYEWKRKGKLRKRTGSQPAYEHDHPGRPPQFLVVTLTDSQQDGHYTMQDGEEATVATTLGSFTFGIQNGRLCFSAFTTVPDPQEDGAQQRLIVSDPEQEEGQPCRRNRLEGLTLGNSTIALKKKSRIEIRSRRSSRVPPAER